MLTHPRVPEAHWTPTLATVENQRRTWDTWFVNESLPGESGAYEMAEFVITFSYAVKGTTYTGKFTANSPREIGETFPILFDPSTPKVNSGSDRKVNPWLRAAVWLGGIAIAFLLIELFPDAEW